MGRFATTIIAACALAFSANTYAATPRTNVNVTPQERAKIEEVVRQYLVQNPEVIIEAVQSFQRKQYEQAEKTVQETQKDVGNYIKPLFKQGNDPVAGNPNGSVTVVEFFDYQCPHCVDMAPVIEGIIKANPDVRIVFKEFPIRGPLSEFASRAALAANKQGKYYEFSHALLTSNKPLTQELVFEVAKQQGLNVDQLKKDMNDQSISDQIKNTQKLAQNLKLFGTPAFFIGQTNAANGKNVIYSPGRMDQNQLQTAIDKAKS